MTKNLERAFTLIEMAIVLVVIGFIVGGVLVGQTTIRSSRIRTITGDASRYIQAFNNFKDKYKALPGDFANAQNFWGTDPAGCPTPATGAPATPYSATLKKQTCNGNGDGMIGGTSNQDFELFRAWQQLSASGLVNGMSTTAFNGISGAGTASNAVLGINVPSTGLQEGGYSIRFISVADGGDINHFTFLNNHVLMLGAVINNTLTKGPLLTPAEALAIDNKLDDGKPGSGTVQPHTNNVNPNCSTTSVASTAAYNVAAYSGIACSLMFITDF